MAGKNKWKLRDQVFSAWRLQMRKQFPDLREQGYLHEVVDLLNKRGLAKSYVPTEAARRAGYVTNNMWDYQKLQPVIAEAKRLKDSRPEKLGPLTFGEVYPEHCQQKKKATEEIPLPPSGRLTYFKNDSEVVQNAKRTLELE